jgi:CubicO group peptidase (beta-lactamase class C family)
MQDPTVKTSGYDFSNAHAALGRYVERDILAGVSAAMLAGRELIDLHCVGWADKEAQTPLRPNHIFRVFSNSKLVTSCAALLLLEEGRCALDDPIEEYLPQLANLRVLRRSARAIDDTEPAHGSITIRHLMTHSSGLSYGTFDPGTTIFKAYNDRKVVQPGSTLAEMVEALAELPLVFQPGTSWEYSVATDVLARLVEVLSGERFDRFLASRIFHPLGMVDTGFVVPEQSRARLSAYYAGADAADPMRAGLTRLDQAPYPAAYLSPVPMLSGGSGLVSTLPDMLALVRSLVPGGPTLLREATLGQAMTNQLPEGVWLRFPGVGELTGKGHGLIGAVVVEPSSLDHPKSRGELFWGGAAGTQWWISPMTNTAGVLMTQRQFAFGHPFAFEFKRLAYEAVERRR